MKNPVDNMLTSRIKQVFDEFEDPGAAAGWEQLRKKHPGSNRRPLILWLSSAAAVLVLATGLWFVNKNETPMAMNPGKEKKSIAGNKTTPLDTVNSFNTSKTVEKRILKQESSTRSKISFPETINPRPERTWIVSLPAESSEKLVSKLTELKTTPEQGIEKATATALEDEIALSKSATLAINDRQGFDKVKIEQAKKPQYVKEFTPEPVENEEKDEKVDFKGKKLALSVFAGSYFNYAEGSENQLNFGAGFTSDIRLGRNLKLSTGLSIASNSLSYDNGQDVPESATSDFHSVSPSTGQNLSLNLTTITRYSASLLTLDVPVNIKYQFIPESDKLYVVAGLSSGTYLNETYGFQYRNFNTASGSYSSRAQGQKIKKQLNDFDFARTLNLSFGISTAFGKTQTMSIEPFVKYPLGGLGTEDLKFGSTGVNLKIRFNPSKK